MVSGEAGVNVPAVEVVLKLTVRALVGIDRVAELVFQLDRDRAGGNPGRNGLRRGAENN